MSHPHLPSLRHHDQEPDPNYTPVSDQQDGNLNDMLTEMRVLLPGAQTLTAFLIIVPFNATFRDINATERWVYVITFLCALMSLILFAAPAAHHRLERPLLDREGFKNWANRFILTGLFFLSISLSLATQLVISQVYSGSRVPWLVSGAVALLVITIWWLLPRHRVKRLKRNIAAAANAMGPTDD